MLAHKIKKFVFHTNYPGHADFNFYIKCNFVIHGSDFGNSFREKSDSKDRITPSIKWEQVKEILGDYGRLLFKHKLLSSLVIDHWCLEWLLSLIDCYISWAVWFSWILLLCCSMDGRLLTGTVNCTVMFNLYIIFN